MDEILKYNRVLDHSEVPLLKIEDVPEVRLSLPSGNKLYHMDFPNLLNQVK